ncbi:energy transducer TonB [Parerythrobacter aurantius]|uniref:energy transducer TonB family protein n=1 Tax=Parerythrobacter aurantius TaxID=3127706 RepID=UPI00325022E5
MKTLALVFSFAALAAASQTPALAESGQDEIVVSPARAMEDWRQSISRNLNRHLDNAVERLGSAPDSGIVQLRFKLDEAGRPVAMQTYRSSGSLAGDRAARWAVRRLDGLDRGPVARTPDTVFQANIIFAGSRAERLELADRLAWMERERLARGDTAVVALGL